MRRICANEKLNVMIASLVSSASLLFENGRARKSWGLFMFTRGLEALITQLANAHYLPKIPIFHELLFIFSFMIVQYSTVYSPSSVSPPFYNAILKMFNPYFEEEIAFSAMRQQV